jgi:hypothetical protein
MGDTVVAAAGSAPRFETASWKRRASMVCGVLLALVFLVSGGWKMLSPLKSGELLEQAQVPSGLGVLGAAALAVLELLAAFLLFMPRYRRWGGVLGSALLVFFIGWIAYFYPVLVGRECSCFPIVKRTVGPGFFVGDAVMLILGIGALAWSRPARGWKIPTIALTVLVIAAGASVFANASAQQNAQVPVPVVVDGKPQNLAVGNVFLFFYDPSCMHCDAASKFMSTLNWGDTRVVAIPTVNPQWAASFLHDTKLKASTSLELDKLKKAFPFVDPPFGVALKDGRVKQTFGQAQFNEPSPAPDLKKLGFVK